MSSAILKSIDDPRTSLDKARRGELYRFALANGVNELRFGGTVLPINDGTPAELLRHELRSRGLTNIEIPRRVLGQPEPQPRLRSSNGNPLTVQAQTPAEKKEPPVVNATADLMRQYQSNAFAPPEPEYDTMKRFELAKLCKAKGIAMERTDKKEDLVEKLRGKDAS